MAKNKNLGFFQLANKSLAVLTTSLTALLSNQAKAITISNFENGNENLTYEIFQKKILKPKLVLKLNMMDPEKSLLAMHGSHSSHASHSSHMSSSPPAGHYSHSSHSSHYSSSPSYSPSEPSSTPSSPVYTPSQSVYTPTKRNTSTAVHITSDSSISDSSLTYYVVGSRNLHKGCKGTDVQEVQQLLINLGYELTADGVFGATTKLIVMQFQRNHYLNVDGIIDSTTLSLLQN